MKNQREIYEVLLAGETLINTGNGKKIHFNVNSLITDMRGVSVFETFSSPQYWEIHTPAKWYENIPEGGVLCWVWDNREASKSITGIISIQFPNEAGFKFISHDCNWINAIPLTKQEIQAFMDNAPNE